ncbi:GAF and ANTAR domain-containing protein [Mycobacterium sp. 852002-51057_SCH5723018]|uniref:GAF and ANTAR domain-containing protein n=1 Tax=Mycobacterium sp. 852002-51057_SCH5723018 TaxID=1834094 RepID=UPI000800419A|nr:GAF and ANTAR domain-containing protein [Mycobacterium sp. 852002-51057_SCH5723018]OBG29611.1 response regulator receiver protein [Mycobacterium sp. 852002-51057_SCH5723018]
MPHGNSTIVAQLAGLVADLGRQETETRVGLNELVHSGVRHIPGCQYSGISLADKNNAVTSVAATHRYPILLDVIQNRYGEGPCLAAIREHHMIRVDDLNADRRWPRYQRCALEQTPIRSILAYGLLVDGTTIAALNFYAEAPRAFDDESLELGGIFASHVALAWSMLRRQDQFRSALASRDTIGQAKGVIMERFNLDADEAFELLTRLSQQSNTKVIDIAKALIDGEHPLKRCHHAERGA